MGKDCSLCRQSNENTTLHEVEPTSIHYHLLEASVPNDAAETETLTVTDAPCAPEEERIPDPAPTRHDVGYREVIEALVDAVP